jgi:hypothetical protein
MRFVFAANDDERRARERVIAESDAFLAFVKEQSDAISCAAASDLESILGERLRAIDQGFACKLSMRTGVADRALRTRGSDACARCSMPSSAGPRDWVRSACSACFRPVRSKTHSLACAAISTSSCRKSVSGWICPRAPARPGRLRAGLSLSHEGHSIPPRRPYWRCSASGFSTIGLEVRVAVAEKEPAPGRRQCTPGGRTLPLAALRDTVAAAVEECSPGCRTSPPGSAP